MFFHILKSDDISLNYDHGKDLQFLIDRQEQYSRKNSIRIRGVREEMGEDIEKVTLETLKKELDLDMEHSEIDIVHRVGPRDDNKPKSILVKFLCHKSKENVMRHTKNATHITITEDLAPGIKRIFNEVSLNRRFLNIESVWTIDGRSKYRYSNNTRSFDIRSYVDYHQLITSRK